MKLFGDWYLQMQYLKVNRNRVVKCHETYKLVSIGQPRSKLSSANWNDVYHERNPKFSPYKVHWIFIYFQTTITFQLYFCAK